MEKSSADMIYEKSSTYSNFVFVAINSCTAEQKDGNTNICMYPCLLSVIQPFSMSTCLYIVFFLNHRQRERKRSRRRMTAERKDGSTKIELVSIER